MIKGGEVNWDKLRCTVHTSVHFLDNVIDANRFPIKEIREMTMSTRKIGLGVMGFADLLYQLGIPYDSEEGIAMGEKVMSFVQDEARSKSAELGKERGLYPAWCEGNPPLRNSTVTTIAPTGTISMIADASSGIEPNFALAYIKTVLDGKNLNYLNKRFEEAALAGGYYSEDMAKMLAQGKALDDIDGVPDELKRVYRTSRDINVKWHIRMQAAFQKYTDNAVSKTINFPNSASEDEIREAFISAFRLNCKGLTVYRDGSREVQVLKSGDSKSSQESDDEKDAREITPTPRRRPRITKGVTERVNTGEGGLYITINEDIEGICEIFTSLGKHGGNAAAQSEAISRLISLCLRCGIEVKSIIKQLKGIAGPNPVWDDGQLILSTPDAIGKVLERHVVRKTSSAKSKTAAPAPAAAPAAEPVKITGYTPPTTASETCPDCGGVVIYEEGCKTCHSCGFSQCG